MVDKENLYTALDIGTTKACTIVGRASPTGGLDVVGLGIVPSRGIHKGQVVDLEETSETVAASVAEAQRTVGRPLPAAYVGVTGAHLTCTNITTSRARLEDDSRAVSYDEVIKLLRHSKPEVTATTEVLHLLPRSYTVGEMRGVQNPVGLSGQHLALEAHVVMGESAPIENIIKAVRSAGLAVRGLVLEPMASAEVVLTADERQLGAVLVDIGGGTSDMVIYQGGSIAYTAALPLGGYQFTNDLAVAFNTSYEAAEEAKIRYGCVDPDSVGSSEEVRLPASSGRHMRSVPRKQFCQALQQRAEDLGYLIHHKVRQAGLERIPPAGIALTGGTAKLSGLAQHISSMIGAPVRLGIPRLAGNLPQQLRDPAYATSLGILVWGSQQRGGELNLGYKPRATPWYRQFAGWFNRRAQ